MRPGQPGPTRRKKKKGDLTIESKRPELRIYPDGDQWCVLLGPNLQEGLSGFGPTPLAALQDFWKSVLGALRSPATHIEAVDGALAAEVDGALQELRGAPPSTMERAEAQMRCVIMRTALMRILKWEMPTPDYWLNYGSNGEKARIREIAQAALIRTSKQEAAARITGKVVRKCCGGSCKPPVKQYDQETGWPLMSDEAYQACLADKRSGPRLAAFVLASVIAVVVSGLAVALLYRF